MKLDRLSVYYWSNGRFQRGIMGTGESFGIEESWQVVIEQRLAIAELLAGLSEADWEQPSLCAGWRVRDVAAHVTLIPIPAPPGSLLVDFAKARGNYARWNTVASRRRAARTPRTRPPRPRHPAPPPR